MVGLALPMVAARPVAAGRQHPGTLRAPPSGVRPLPGPPARRGIHMLHRQDRAARPPGRVDEGLHQPHHARLAQRPLSPMICAIAVFSMLPGVLCPDSGRVRHEFAHQLDILPDSLCSVSGRVCHAFLIASFEIFLLSLRFKCRDAIQFCLLLVALPRYATGRGGCRLHCSNMAHFTP